MKEKLMILEEIVRMTCSLSDLDKKMVLAYIHITRFRMTCCDFWHGSPTIPGENFIQLWEYFKSKSSYEFVRDLLMFAYEHDGDDEDFKLLHTFDGFSIESLTYICPQTDEIKHILIRGITDPDKSFMLRVRFLGIFCHSFYDNFVKELTWLDIYSIDDIHGCTVDREKEILDNFHLYVNTEIPNDLSVSIPSSNDECFSSCQEVSKSNSILQVFRKLKEFAQPTISDFDEYQNEFLMNCLDSASSLCDGSITKGSFCMREENTILPELALWQVYNPESYEQFILEILKASYNYAYDPLTSLPVPSSRFVECLSFAIPPSEGIRKILTLGLWDRTKNVKYRLDCFTKLHICDDSSAYMLNFCSNDIERFIQENESNLLLVVEIISAICMFIDLGLYISDKKFYAVVLAYADAHPEIRVALLSGWLDEEFEEISEKIRAQKDDDTLDKITIPDMTFVPIPSGEFLMGYTESTSSITEKAFPGIQVAVEGFEMLSTPVTMGMWKSLFNYCPVAGLSDDSAIYKLCLYDCIKFATALSAIDDEYDYRLPTEAEYEYAAKAGITSEYCFGYKAMEETTKESDNEAQPNRIVGNSAPNPWGLYDMCGLIKQYCSGSFNPVYPLSNLNDRDKCGLACIVKGDSSATYSEYITELGFGPGFRLVKELKRVSF